MLFFKYDSISNKPCLFQEEPYAEKEEDEFNQIKYVCRQLYHETKGIELRCNKICFHQKYFHSQAPAPIFSKFTSSIAPRKISWLTHIVIATESYSTGQMIKHGINKMLEPADNIMRMADFCRSNPHVTVDYIAGCLWLMKEKAASDAYYHYNVLGWLCKGLGTDEETKQAENEWLSTPNLNFWPVQKLNFLRSGKAMTLKNICFTSHVPTVFLQGEVELF